MPIEIFRFAFVRKIWFTWVYCVRSGRRRILPSTQNVLAKLLQRRPGRIALMDYVLVYFGGISIL